RLQQLAIQHLNALLMANSCHQEYENLPNPSTLLRDEPFFSPRIFARTFARIFAQRWAGPLLPSPPLEKR
ncbi:hypothetical protein, partial [Achromobacter spanius]|uniref:hypothetical protein n=1 Tax=Achromobacter spanius TaxID=217203 RepID=UPI00320A052E